MEEHQGFLQLFRCLMWLGWVLFFLRPLTNGITLASLVYSGPVNVGKHVKMGGYQEVDGPSTLHNVLVILNSKRKLVSKD